MRSKLAFQAATPFLYQMHRVSADFVLTPHGLERGLCLTLDEEGILVDLQPADEARPQDHRSGIICPAFVNAHCHLELSHVKGAIPKHTGMAGFIQRLQSIRHTFTDKQRSSALSEAVTELHRNGTAAVGDICNGSSSLPAKTAFPQLIAHNFIELFGMDPRKADAVFEKGLDLATEFPSATLTAHAPYSVSKTLRDRIYQQAKAREQVLSIHLLESQQERQLFAELEGPLFDLFHSWGLVFQPRTYTSPLGYILEGLPTEINTLLVHCTQLTEPEIERVTSEFPKVFFVLCPRANKYIHNQLPPAKAFSQHPNRICIGTDSLAGNDSLDPLAEIQLLQTEFDLPTEMLLRWAGENGARALDLDVSQFQIKEGNRPFLLHISGIAGENAKFTPQSRTNWL